MAAVLFFLYVWFSERMNVCVHVSSCLRGAVLHFVRVCCALSVCTSLLRTGDAECMITEESTTSFP